MNVLPNVNILTARFFTPHILHPLIIAGDVRSLFFIRLSTHQNSIPNRFFAGKDELVSKSPADIG